MKLGIVNSFLVKGNRTVIVDAGYAGNGDKILCYLHEHLIEPEDISLIVLTHGHIDHYGSAAELRKITGAPIAMHRADAENIKNGINHIGSPACLSGWILKSLYKGTDMVRAEALEADIIFDNDCDLREFGIAGSVIHTPGHTEGSISLILSGGEAIVGDLVMGGLLFRKVPHYPLFSTSMSDLKRSIKKIVELSPTIIYASHGGPFSVKALKAFCVQRTAYSVKNNGQPGLL